MKRSIVALAVALFFFPYWWGFTHYRACPGGCCQYRAAAGKDQGKQEENAAQKKKTARRICGPSGCRIVWESVELPPVPVKE